MVGAGTVLTYEEAMEVIEVGAAFLLSPTVFERRILDLCRERGVVSVPGTFSPLEIRQSFLDGAGIVKMFPAGGLGSEYMSDIRALLERMPLMVVGGIGTSSVRKYFTAGAPFAGIDSGIFLKEDILNENEERIRGSIVATEEKMKSMEEKES